MKRMLSLTGLIALVALIVPVSSTAAPPPITIELLNPPKDGLLELAVGQSYTFDIVVTTSEPFVLAMALADAVYPGRGVFSHGIDTAHHATAAFLHLTMSGKEPTDFLPGGVAPVGIAAGVRYQGGVVYSERFDFVVRVVP